MSTMPNGFRSRWLFASTEFVGGKLVGRWKVERLCWMNDGNLKVDKVIFIAAKKMQL